MIRSEKVILVKNLPYTADEKELLALVYFSVPSEAKRAFNHLSYRKYQHTPLYLEYLPLEPWNDRAIA